MNEFFSKSSEELRTAFVGHRISRWFWGQDFHSPPSYTPAHFLKMERNAQHPAPLWGNVHLNHIVQALDTKVIEAHDSTPLDLLRRVSPVGVPLENLRPGPEDWTRNLIACLKQFCRLSVEVSMVKFKHGTLLLFLKEGMAFNVWVVKDGSGQTLVHAYADFSWRDALHGLVYLWNHSGQGWEQARAILCDLMTKVLEVFRAQQVATFDSAVAVSDDGTKIVCADEILVFGVKQYWSFPASRFRDAKILLSPGYEERGTSSDGIFLQIIQVLSGSHPFSAQHFVHFHDGAQRQIFITAAEYCPPAVLTSGAGISIEA